MEQEHQFIPVDEKPIEIADFISLSQEQNWGIAACAIQEAWRVTKGAGIRVAVLDTGISVHDDLKDAWTEAYNCSNEASYDDINSGHGTHVAGIIGARDNALGVIGVAPECTLIPIKVLNNNGSGNFGNIAAGIRKAIEVKADIISMSLGTSSEPPIDVNRAIKEATNAGIPVIGVSNTDNITSKIDLVIPANNRGRKSLATIYWLLAREILIGKGEIKSDDQMKYEIDDFETKITEEEEIE